MSNWKIEFDDEFTDVDSGGDRFLLTGENFTPDKIKQFIAKVEKEAVEEKRENLWMKIRLNPQILALDPKVYKIIKGVLNKLKQTNE